MTVMVLFKDAYIIDYEENRIINKSVTDDLNGYIKRLSKSIEDSDRLQYFKTEDESTQVINNVKLIINDIENNATENIPEKMKSISLRLLEKEIEVQVKIERMGKNVKRGSLLQTVFFDSLKNEYNYLITKTEHTQYMEENKFSIQSGFKIDEENLWKSCLIQINKDDDKLKVGDIRVYLDNTAAYWHKDFLEIAPIRADQQNTKQLFSSIEKILKNHVYKESKYDFTVLRNALINYIRNQSRMIDYYILVREIFGEYTYKELGDESKNKLINALQDLPKKNKFDVRFTPDPTALNVRVIKQCYELSDNIDLVLKDTTKIENKITSEEDNHGNRYIKIETNNYDAYETFLRKPESD